MPRWRYGPSTTEPTPARESPSCGGSPAAPCWWQPPTGSTSSGSSATTSRPSLFGTPEIQPERIAALLGGDVRIEPFPVPRDCLDGFAEAFWAQPEAYLDPRIRAGMSPFGLLDEAEIGAGLRQLQADLRSGTWDARNGDLR